MLKILIQNLWGYDLLIFVAALINVVIFIKIVNEIKLIDMHLNKTNYLQNELIIQRINVKSQSKSSEELSKILDDFTKSKHQLDQSSVFYSSLTSIFPLLGILGTVIALLSLSDFSKEIVSINFSIALTSTFWGILFGAISKFGEGFFTAKIDLYDKMYSEVRANLLAIGLSVGAKDE
jgi:chemotaxis protein MotA